MPENNLKSFLFKNAKWISLLGVFVLTLIIPLTLYTAQQRQNADSKAFLAGRKASTSEFSQHRVPTKLAMGNRVQAVRRIHVWSGTSIKSNASGKQKNGAQGVIIDGPILVLGTWYLVVEGRF